MDRAPVVASRWDSHANELNVVNEPQNPMPTSASTELPSLRDAANAPNIAEPATLTLYVPQGNNGVHRRWITTSIHQRVGAPSAAPEATSRAITARGYSEDGVLGESASASSCAPT